MDSNDRDRVVEARDELHRMLNEVNSYTAQRVPSAICVGLSPCDFECSLFTCSLVAG